MPRARQPRAHWGLLAVLLLLLAVGLSLSGYASHRVGQASTVGSAASDRGGLPEGTGSLVDLSNHGIRSLAAPSKTVVLTFDDGPDRRWTPQILDVLARNRVPATFFVVGARVGSDPGLVRRTIAEGHEIGAHTFSHRDISSLSGWELNLQMSLTQVELAGSAGVHTSLFRPPYSATPRALSPRDVDALRPIADDGYLIVLSDYDSRDWERPGVRQIVRAALPQGDAGGIVLFHDGGGDRSQTVSALKILIPELKRRGFQFATVSDLAHGGSPKGTRDAQAAVTGAPRLCAVALVRLQQASALVARVVELLLIPIGLLTIARALLVVLLARRHVKVEAARPSDGGFLPPVSIIVPAFNEEAGIAASVISLADSAYPDLEVIVVDDGSTDRTSQIVRELDHPLVKLITQENTGKPGAINAGVAACAHDIVVCVDGDTVFEPDTVARLVAPLADPTVGAVSGNTKVINRRGLLGRWQHLEYVMGFNLDRRMYEHLNCMPTVPGAIGAFRRSVLVEVGGVSDDTLAEDTDLTMAVNRAGRRVVYAGDAVAWTEAPASLNNLWRQRYRWSYGTMQAMWKHRRAVFDREHGGIGRRALPYMLLFQVLLPLLAPVIDLWAIYGLAFLDPWPVIGAWLAFNLVQAGIATYAFRLDGESLRPLWVLPAQQLVYRQLMYLVVIQSIITALLGVHLPWQRVERTGALDQPRQATGS